MIALVGAGKWGRNYIRVLNEKGALEVVCDKNPELSDWFDSPFVCSLSSVLSNPKVLGVVIASPATTHFEIAKKCLLAGKDVLVEKPMATKAREVRELKGVAEENGRILMCGHLLHYHPAFIKLKEIVGNGEIGDVYYIKSMRANIGTIRTEEDVLWSFAPHDISMCISILGIPRKIECDFGCYLNGIPDVTSSILSFSGNKKAHIFVSWLYPQKVQSFAVVGSNGTVFFDGVGNTLVKKEYNIKRVTIDGYKEETIFFEGSEPLANQIDHFIERIKDRDRKELITGPNEALLVVSTIEQLSKLKSGGFK